VALLVTLVAWPGRDAAALDASLTVEPTMTRGAPDAPVTIVEFSDYQ
jgi:protein-disulfide isomerase